MFNENICHEIKELLLKANSIIITTHRNPDGDALGATLALQLFLKLQYEKTSLVLVPDAFPTFLDWMPGAENIAVFNQNPTQFDSNLKNADLVFCLDYNHPSRTADMEKSLVESPAIKIMLDHHQQPSNFVQFTWSDTKASSTSEIVYLFAKKMNWLSNLNIDIATCIYTGIMTDTGSFRFSVTSAETFRIVTHLKELGLEHWKIHEALFNQNSFNKLKLWGYALSEVMVNIPEISTTYIYLTDEVLKKYDYQEGDTEGLVNYALSVEGTILGVLLSEKEGKIRISFRSIGSFSVNKLSKENFEGGGHENAAGGISQLPMPETINKLMEVLKEIPELRK
jgi:phosphoesterase RecJ-like protein